MLTNTLLPVTVGSFFTQLFDLNFETRTKESTFLSFWDAIHANYRIMHNVRLIAINGLNCSLLLPRKSILEVFWQDSL
jgi:hypothetical protein